MKGRCDLDEEHDDGGGVKQPGHGGDDSGPTGVEQHPDLIRRHRSNASREELGIGF